MPYVIRKDGGMFVADMRKSRTGGSYTRDLMVARIYPTEAAAEADRCPENERVYSVDTLLYSQIR